MSAEALALAGVVAVAVIGTLAFVIRECLRPELSSHWSERDFGDQPNVDVFHNGTDNR